MAASEGGSERVAPLVGAGAVLDAADESGQTVAFKAARTPELVALPLTLGSDPNVEDGSGRTLLQEVEETHRDLMLQLPEALRENARSGDRPPKAPEARYPDIVRSELALLRELRAAGARS